MKDKLFGISTDAKETKPCLLTIAPQEPFIVTYLFLLDSIQKEHERFSHSYRGCVLPGKPVSVVSQMLLDYYNRPLNPTVVFNSKQGRYQRTIDYPIFNIVTAPVYFQGDSAFYVLMYEPAPRLSISSLDPLMRDKFHEAFCADTPTQRSSQGVLPPMGETPERGIRFEGILYENKEATLFQLTSEFMPERFSSDPDYEIYRDRYMAQQVRFAQNTCPHIIQYLSVADVLRINTRE